MESVLQFKKNKTEQSENPVGTGAGDNDSQDDSQDLKTANHRTAPKQIFKPHNWDMQIFSLLALQTVEFSETIIGLTGRVKRATRLGVRCPTVRECSRPSGLPAGQVAQ